MQSSYDQMFNLRDVFYYILKRWRNVFLFGLIGAILLGSFSFFKMIRTNSSATEKSSDNPKPTVGKLTDKEEKTVEEDILKYDSEAQRINSRLEFLTARYQKLNKQTANSLYLSMADTEQFFFEFDIKVLINLKEGMNEEDIDESLRILTVEYNNQFFSEAFFKYIEYQTNGLVPYDQVRDLMKTDISSSDNIHVVLTAPEDVLPSLKDAVILYIETRAEDTILFSNDFTTELFNEVSSVDSNEKIQDQLAEINEQIINLSLEIDECEIKLQERIEEAKPIFSEEFLGENLEEIELKEIKEESIPSHQVKNEISKTSLLINIFLDFLLGEFLIVIWYIYKIMSSKNIFDVNALSNNFGLMVINQIYVFEDKSVSKIDKWINTKYLKGKKYVSKSLTDQVSYTKILVEILMKRDNPELTESKPYKIGIVGELTDERSAALIDELEKDNEFLSVSKFSLFPSTEIELRKMSEVGSMILIIKTHDTEISKICHFIDLATEMHKEILGVVSIECL